MGGGGTNRREGPVGVIGVLRRFVIAATLPSIGKQAFSGCSALASVTFPAGLTSIGDHASPYCPALASVTVPTTAEIGDEAFDPTTTVLRLSPASMRAQARAAEAAAREAEMAEAAAAADRNAEALLADEEAEKETELWLTCSVQFGQNNKKLLWSVTNVHKACNYTTYLFRKCSDRPRTDSKR